MAKVNFCMAKNFSTEFTAHQLFGFAFVVMKLHMGAEAPRTDICLPADPAAVQPPARVHVHVVLEMVLKLERMVTNMTSVQRLRDG